MVNLKKILVPCDFSDISENALDYALNLCIEFSSELVLLHVNQYPVMNPEVGLSAYTYQDAKKDSLEGLDKIANRIRSSHPSIRVSCFAEMGDITEEIMKYSKTSHADLIVVGISGHGNSFMKNIIGSNAVSVSKKSEKAVLIIPPKAEYKKPHSIAFACNYGEGDESNPVLLKAKDFCSLFKADLHILHIISEKHPVKHTEVIIDTYEEHKLENSPHRTFVMSEKNASQGILHILNNKLADMIIIEPKKHSLFHNLFYQSVTNEVAFKSPVPVLALHK
jgi:nucleotide-binding universal stress UspA family protein